jgi:hypothetical protein
MLHLEFPQLFFFPTELVFLQAGGLVGQVFWSGVLARSGGDSVRKRWKGGFLFRLTQRCLIQLAIVALFGSFHTCQRKSVSLCECENSTSHVQVIVRNLLQVGKVGS